MKNKKGISLIVLIITIVVIIILAATIILNLKDTNIIGNANEAVVKQDFKTFESELDLYIADEFVDTKGKLDVTTIDATTKEDVVKIIPSIKGSKYEDYVTIVDGKIAIFDTMPEEEKQWINEVIDLEIATSTTPEPPKEPAVTPDGEEIVFDNTEGTANATINGGAFAYNNPVVPVGFMAINTTDANWNDANGWNNGLVIEDASGNEFVWVPCTTNENDTNKIQYTKKLNEYPKNTIITSVSDDIDALPDGITEETDQIKKYAGFYIGRYEAGVPANQTTIDGTKGDGSTSKSDADGIPVVQKGAIVWTNISYNKAMLNAKLFINTANVKSGIVTGTQWDTVCAWIQRETDSEENPIHDVTNSINWGNYNNDLVVGSNGKQVTGFSESWKAKNIYDIAGNTYEWTGESNNYSDRIIRGGYYNCDGSIIPASYRHDPVASNTFSYASFRIALYVM